MKKAIILTVITALSITVKAQKKDSTSIDSLNLPLITINDFQTALTELSNSKVVTPNEYNLLQQFAQKVISEAIVKRKQIKPKK